MATLQSDAIKLKLVGSPRYNFKPIKVTAGALTGISINEAASVKNVFLNAAATWSANNTGNLTATGTITIKWTKLS